jgi:hypothetical protein
MIDMDKINDCWEEAQSCDIAHFLFENHIYSIEHAQYLHEDGLSEETLGLFFDDLHNKIQKLKKLKKSALNNT